MELIINQYPMEQVSYDAIGTRAAPATLTAAYTGNTKTLSCKYLPDLQIEVRYTPLLAQTDRYALILVETSNDGGTTFTPVSAKQVTTTGLDCTRKEILQLMGFQ